MVSLLNMQSKMQSTLSIDSVYYLSDTNEWSNPNVPIMIVNILLHSHGLWIISVLYGPLDITTLLVGNIWGAVYRSWAADGFTGHCVVWLSGWRLRVEELLNFDVLCSHLLRSFMNYAIWLYWKNIHWTYPYFDLKWVWGDDVFSTLIGYVTTCLLECQRVWPWGFNISTWAIQCIGQHIEDKKTHVLLCCKLLVQ